MRVGRRATFDALKQGAVYTLMVQDEFRIAGALCHFCNEVASIPGKCPRSGNDLRLVADLMEEAVDQALSQDAQIYHLSGHPLLDIREEIGAKLRFPLFGAATRPAGEAA